MKDFTMMNYWCGNISNFLKENFLTRYSKLKNLMTFVFLLLSPFAFSQVVVQGTAPVNTPNYGMEIDGDARAATGDPLGGDWFFAQNPDPAQKYGALFKIEGGELVPVYPDVEGDLPRTILQIDDLALKGAIDGTIFTGTNKINDDPNTYTWGPGNVSPKDEMQNVAVHFTRGVDGSWAGEEPPTVNDDIWCLFAADRAVTNGDSYIDFEFLQSSLTMTGENSGGFVSDGEHGGRTINDILISVAFSNGGAEPIVVVYEWQEVGTNAYEYVEINSGVQFYATSNTSETEVPFPIYDVPQNPDGTYTYEINQWVEGAFNLTALFNALSDSCINLSTLFIRTRSSGESNNSELFDFPEGPIALDIDFTPDAPTAESVAACESWDGTLTATCEEGTPRWYSDDNGEKGTFLSEGTSFEPGEITETTSFWVVCSIEGCEGDPTMVTVRIDDPVDAGEPGEMSFCSDEDLSEIDLFDLLGGTPDEGGAWTEGEASVNSPIDLSGYDAGEYTFTYTVTPEEGSECEPDMANVVITLYDPVDAGENGAMSYCSDEDLSNVDLFALLEGNPDEGGTWAEGENSASSPVDLSEYDAGIYTFTYTVTPVEDSVCEEDSADVVITIYDPVDAGDNGSEAYCIDEDLSNIDLFALLEGTPDEGGTWTEGEDPATSPIDLSEYDAGSYTFTYTVTPEEGSVCEEKSADVFITIYDVVDAGEGSTLQFCQGDPTQNMVNLFDLLTGEDAGGEWEDTDASGANIENPESVNFTSIPAGSYTFTYTITPSEGSECEPDSEEVEVIIDPLPDIPEYQTSLADCLGGDGGLVFTNVGENMYYSIDGGEFVLYTGEISLPVGFYDFRIRYDEDGCISEEFQIEIQRPDDDIVTLAPEVIQPDCDTLLGTIMITNAGELGDLNYTVTNQDTSTDYYTSVAYPMGGFTGLPAGNYYISVISDNGCITGNVNVTLDEPICEDFEGCTLGYWKNHTDRWPASDPDSSDEEICYTFTTCYRYGDVFTNAPSSISNMSLLEALNANGGGIMNLARQSVAALLNACSNEINFEIATAAEVIAYVNAGFNDAGTTAYNLDMMNNAGCTLGGSRATTAPSESCSSSSASSVDASAGISVSPVPFKDHLNIKYEFDYESAADIQIFDMRGNLVKSHRESNAGFGKVTTLNADFVRGEQMYIVKVTTSQGTYTKNVVSGKN